MSRIKLTISISLLSAVALLASSMAAATAKANGAADDMVTMQAVSQPSSNSPAAADAFGVLAQECAPSVHRNLLGRVATVESSGNPFAIGVVHGHLAHQPKNLPEAIATVKALDAGGWNYSMGLVQVNVRNLARYGQTAETIFEPCTNLKTGAAILKACYGAARARFDDTDDAVHSALSCYYSGDLTRGAAYAQKVAASIPVPAVQTPQPIEVMPDVRSATRRGLSGGSTRASQAPAHPGPKDTAKSDWFTTYDDDQDDGTAMRPSPAKDSDSKTREDE
ncbi:lytic transglycosylase domain-containing protein [Caballeronia sordidicola]|uniref:Peptidoglycan hydrolase VirB1, involved in T-DNA transfer n=1 Tax=Caballeronia sordidicola TaxID=196367 RepID=A0A242N489_CABSO|nr:lytic transglycosylase domain-containing protein [Caballeronia sordidicola]OTP78488.1 Peptidoglycan hydrolase VirB1, involved in T-DNA transfer [Caballeronia sordidicola]